MAICTINSVWLFWTILRVMTCFITLETLYILSAIKFLFLIKRGRLIVFFLLLYLQNLFLVLFFIHTHSLFNQFLHWKDNVIIDGHYNRNINKEYLFFKISHYFVLRYYNQGFTIVKKNYIFFPLIIFSHLFSLNFSNHSLLFWLRYSIRFYSPPLYFQKFDYLFLYLKFIILP